MKFKLLPALAIGLLPLALAPMSPAQTLLSVDNGGLTAVGPMIHEFQPDCVHRGQCSLQGIFGPSIPNPYGGIAYNWLDQTVWVTDGNLLVQTDLACNVLQRCSIPSSAANRWTGLAIDPVQDMLYFTTPMNGIFKVPARCPVSRYTQVCSLGPALLNLTGIEVDPWDDSLWVCDNMGTVYHLATSSSGGCRLITSFRARCPNTTSALPIQGITVDRCRARVYLSDARFGVITLDESGTTLHCCRLPGPSPAGANMVGLTLRPRPVRYRGTGCSARPCPNCTPELVATSDPHIPNPNFALRVIDGPVGAAAFFLFSPGAGNISTPTLCGPLRVDIFPPPIVIGPLGLISTGGGVCSGRVTLPVPIPADPSLCGGDVHTQVFGLCLASIQIGHFLTNGALIQL